MSVINEQHSKMLHLMNWKEDRLNESYAPTKTIELTKTGADGKTYAILREGSRYCLKVTEDASKKNIAEAYVFAEGFRSRDKYTYNSYADAIKDMDLKMYALNEAYAKENEKAILIETTNPDYKERLVVEGTEEMRNQIARQRQIMANAMLVSEGEFRRGPGVDMGPVGHGTPFGDKSLETNEVGANNGFPTKPTENPFNADGTPKGSNDPDKPFTKEVSSSITNGGKAAMEPVRMDEGEGANDDTSLQVIDLDGEGSGEAAAALEEPAGDASTDALGDEGVPAGDDTTPAGETPAAGEIPSDAVSMILDKLEAITKRLDDLEFGDSKLLDDKDKKDEDDKPADKPESEGDGAPADDDTPEGDGNIFDFGDDEKSKAMQEALARQLAQHPRFQQILKEEKARFAREQFLARRRANRK